MNEITHYMTSSSSICAWGASTLSTGTEGGIKIYVYVHHWPRVWVILSTGHGLRDQLVMTTGLVEIFVDIRVTHSYLMLEVTDVLGRSQTCLFPFVFFSWLEFWNVGFKICCRKKTCYLCILRQVPLRV